jgi:hypothetical protein
MSIRAVHHLNCGMMPCDDRLVRPNCVRADDLLLSSS